MDASTWAAWWGAASGTLAVVWEVFRWTRSGPRLEVIASPNMQIITPGEGIDETLYINVVVTNGGDAPTTITHFCACTYRNWFDRLRRKKSQQFVINPGPESPIPHKIQVGERWSAMTLQEKAAGLVGDSLFYIGVQHALARKPNYVRVKLASDG